MAQIDTVLRDVAVMTFVWPADVSADSQQPASVTSDTRVFCDTYIRLCNGHHNGNGGENVSVIKSALLKAVKAMDELNQTNSSSSSEHSSPSAARLIQT